MAREGARRIDLDVLSPAESVELISRIVGRAPRRRRGPGPRRPRRVLRPPSDRAADRGRDRGRPTGLPIRQLVKELRERGRGASRSPTTRRARCASARSLAGRAARGDAPACSSVLGVTGGGPGRPIGTVAALCDMTLERAADHLDQLADAHLIREPAPDRYAIHDLLSGLRRRPPPAAPSMRPYGTPRSPSGCTGGTSAAATPRPPSSCTADGPAALGPRRGPAPTLAPRRKLGPGSTTSSPASSPGSTPSRRSPRPPPGCSPTPARLLLAVPPQRGVARDRRPRSGSHEAAGDVTAPAAARPASATCT